ncbi:MAG TPA: hypothetical protein VLT45_13715 [Kofleriaceae bacterium]|nr:hypothetical protein [Kofleriaceae bacterium]
MLDFIKAGGVSMLFLIAFGIAILIPAVKFARNADPQRLSLIRALTLVIVFATIVGVTSGLATTCHYVAGEAPKEPLPVLLQGFAESVTNVILGGGILVVAWILVAVGVRRMPEN